jgi:hypothetical protein
MRLELASALVQSPEHAILELAEKMWSGLDVSTIGSSEGGNMVVLPWKA